MNDIYFKDFFSCDQLKSKFEEKFSKNLAKGVDRISGPQFVHRADKEFLTVSAKCLSGKYRFSPYLETLKLKGRNKYPRIIGIPTLRDRVVLNQLNVYLASKFPLSVSKNVASVYVRNISSDLRSINSSELWVCSCDIKTFYDSIDRVKLLAILSKEISCPAAMALIRHAIYTPIVPQNTSRKKHAEFRAELGVPQGLAISNILAAIYMHDVDSSMMLQAVKYYRYVDDVIMYGEQKDVERGIRSLRSRLAHKKLSLHRFSSGKGHIGPVSDEFSYLGYSFQWPVVTVRPSTRERFLQSIAAKFSDYIHNRFKRLERYKYLTADRLYEIFLMELNERITGAVSENRRYGWVSYFSQITDRTLFYKLDCAIASMFSRLEECGGTAPVGLKKLSRAYFEIQFNPRGGYVRDYDVINTVAEKLAFLVGRGRCAPDEPLTELEILERFDNYKNKILSEMYADEGVMY